MAKRPSKPKDRSSKASREIAGAVGPSMGESRTVRIRKIENGYIVSTEEYKKGKYSSKDVYTEKPPKLDVPSGKEKR